MSKIEKIKLEKYIQNYFLKIINFNKNEKTENEKIYVAYTISMIHYYLIFCVMLYILFGNINGFWYIIFILYNLLVIQNIYFNGCILTRLEKELFNDENYKGFISLIFSKDKDNSKSYNKKKPMYDKSRIIFYIISVFLILGVGLFRLFFFPYNNENL